MRADAPQPSVDRLDEPVTRWLFDAPRSSVDVIPALPDGVVIPDGVVANLTGIGTVVCAIVVKPGVYADLTGRGTLTAVIRVKVAVLAPLTSEGTVLASASLPARLTGVGTLSATAWPTGVRAANLTGTGTAAAAVLPVGTTTAPLTGSGTATGAIAVAVTAALTGSGALSAVVLGGIPVTAALTGSGSLSASSSFQYAVAAPLTGSGSASATVETAVVAADLTGTGTASAVAVKVGVSLSDDFNRANGALGANWTAIGTAPTIVTNRAQAGTPGFNSTVFYAARHVTVLNGDTQEVTFVPIAATANAAATVGGGAFLRCDSSGNRVEVAITSTQVIIGTRISGTATNRATAASTGTPSVRMTAVGTLYSAYLNGSGTPAVTWTDSGGLVSIGSGNRYAGIVTAAIDSFGSVSRGWSIDSWTAADI